MARQRKVSESEARFRERFDALTRDLSDGDLIVALGKPYYSPGAISGIRNDGKMLKLDRAMNLCRYLTEHGRPTMPWDLLGEAPIGAMPPVVEAESLAQAVAGEAATGLEALTQELREVRARLDRLEGRATGRRRVS